MTVSRQEMRSYLQIDRDRLDEVVSNQPEQFYQIARAHAFAVSRLDAAKEDLKTTDAKLNLEIRDELESSGSKFTEAQLAARVQAHDRHRAAYEVYSKAQKRVADLGALKDAMSQRSHAVHDLVEWMKAQLTMGTSSNGTAREASDMQYQKTRRRLAEGRKARRSDGG